MYIRKKIIHNKKTGAHYQYAYVVENTWHKKGARQKVKHYLGKVHTFALALDTDFFAHEGIAEDKREEFLSTHTAKQLIQKMVLWELKRHAVEGFLVDMEKGFVSIKGKPASIQMGEGMLNSYTLKQLLFFVAEGNDSEDGYAFAKAFVEAGVAIPQEVFVAVFSKVMEQGKV